MLRSGSGGRRVVVLVVPMLVVLGAVLLFGSGTGRSSAMEMLLADLKAHHADVAEKVIGSVVVDAHHTTENQLLARAREFYAEYNRK